MVNRRVGNLRKESNGGSRKGGFEYRPPSADFVKRQSERKTSRFDSIFKSNFDTFRPTEGENNVRLLPPTWDGSDDYAYPIFLHRYVGIDNGNYLCPRKMNRGGRCPICDEAQAARKGGEGDEAKSLEAGESQVVFLIDRKSEKPVPLLYMMPITLYKDINTLAYDSRSGEAVYVDNPDEGFDLRIRRTGSGLNTRYLPTIERNASPLDDDPKVQQKLLDFIEEHPIPDCLEFKSEEYLERVMSGTGAEKDPDLDRDEDEDRPRKRPARDEEEDEPSPRKRARDEEEDNEPAPRGRRAASRDEEESEEDEPRDRRISRGDEDREPEEEDEPPRKRLRARDQEDEDQDDEPPPRKRGRSSDEDDEPPPSRRRAKEDEGGRRRSR